MNGYAYDAHRTITTHLFICALYHIDDWPCYASVDTFFVDARVIHMEIPRTAFDAPAPHRFAIYYDANGNPSQGGVVFAKAPVGELLVSLGAHPNEPHALKLIQR